MRYAQSPILALENEISCCAFKIAPERANDLVKWKDLNNLSLRLIHDSGFDIRVLLSEKEIVINIASLEFLWASIHAHWVLYDEYSQAQQQGNELFDTGGSERSRNAINLLTWAIKNIASPGTERWPDNLPYPKKFPNDKSDILVANELFLCAVAWIIHHEIAHIRLDHQPLVTALSIAEEKEADIIATKWILEKSDVPLESKKRILGIVVAILAMQGLRSSAQFGILQTHPSTFERIDYCLNEAGVSDNDNVFAFAAVIMQIQLAFRGINKKHDGKTYKDMYSEYLIEFAQTSKD